MSYAEGELMDNSAVDDDHIFSMEIRLVTIIRWLKFYTRLPNYYFGFNFVLVTPKKKGLRELEERQAGKY